MKKLIVLPNNSEIKVGDIVQSLINKQVLFIVKYKEDLKLCKNYQKVHFYIVDTKAAVDDYLYIYVEGRGIFIPNSQTLRDKTIATKDKGMVIATSNSELPIAQLTKESIELIIAKNGELEEFDVAFSLDIFDELLLLAIIILKETLINSNNICRNCGIEAIPSKGLINIHNIQTSDLTKEFEDKYVDCLKCPKCGHSWIPNTIKKTSTRCDCKTDAALACNSINCETSTNETLEEVGERELKPSLCNNWNHNCFNNEDLINSWVIGYKHCEKTMYSQEDISHAIAYAIHQSKLGNTHATILEEWNKQNKK